MRRLFLLMPALSAVSLVVASSLGAIPGMAAPLDSNHTYSGVVIQRVSAAHHDHDHDHEGHEHAHDDAHHHDHQVSATEETLLGEGAPQVTITEGHIDLGPRLVDGQWVLAARDDTAKTPVWRRPADMAFVLGENAVLRVPDNADYKFLGVAPDTPVYVIGQNQVSGVPWLGWNTQAPELAQAGVAGVKLQLVGHEGPGEVQVFLQSGNFGTPQVVWSTAQHQVSEIYIDANTHTHANWVFTQPGVHLLQFRVLGADNAGNQISATALLRFAVGKDVTPAQALAATWKESSSFEMAPHADAKTDSDTANKAGDNAGDNAASAATSDAARNPAGETKPQSGLMTPGWWLPLVGGMAVVLIPVGVIILVRRRIQEREAVAKCYAEGNHD